VFLAEKLSAAGMSRGGVIVNRVHVDGLGGHSPEEVTALLAPDLGDSLAARVAHNLADFDVLVQRDKDTIEGLSLALGEADPILVPELDQDVQDLAGLDRIAKHLFA
jgi:hypothetical protein